MADRIVSNDDSSSSASMLGPVGERMLKEAFNEMVEQPINSLIRGYNYLSGDNLPKLNISGLEDKPAKPVKYIKA